MLVCANNGNFPAEDMEQLRAALNAACGEIWLGEGTDSYPCIAILCCEDGASINYFESEGGTAYVSVGDRKKHGTTWAEAVAKAKAENKLIFIDFYTPMVRTLPEYGTNRILIAYSGLLL